MKSQVKGVVSIDAVTEPFLIEAYVRMTAITVFERQVEVVVYFDDVNVPEKPGLSLPKKVVCRDPQVVAFMNRLHRTIGRRFAAIDAAMGNQSQEDAA